MSVTGDSGDPKFPLICRLCGAPSHDGVEIFSAKGHEICLPEKISKCLPVVIREEDGLPKGVCTLCQGKLEFCRQFFEQIYNATVKLLSVLREEEGANIGISFEDQMLQFVRNYANPMSSKAEEEEDVVEEEELEDEDEEVEEGEEEEDLDSDDGERVEPENAGLSGAPLERSGPPLVKAEPRDLCDVELKEQVQLKDDKEQVKHFLDQLLDDYKDTNSGSNRRKRGRPRKREQISYKEELPEEEDEEEGEDDDYDDADVKFQRGKSSLSPKARSTLMERRALVCPPLKVCVECGLESASHQENLDHWSKAHPNQPILYRCDWENCAFSSTVVTEMKKHRRQHLIDTKQLERCDKCNKYYPAKYLQTRHALVHVQGKNFKCPVCEKGFKTPENLKVHSRIHGPDDVKYTHCCDLCGRRFTQKANLEAHMRVHTGLRPFSCDFCEKNFSQKGNLDEHRRTHTGEKPYVCDICGSRHTRKGELLLHIRCIHTHERPFQCSFCPKNFQRRDLLRKHERIHTDTRPYGCEFCGKTFTARDKMIVHRRLHTGERPYICNFCGRGFCESGNLKKHLRVHGKDIPAVIRQNNKGRSAERQDLAELEKGLLAGGGEGQDQGYLLGAPGEQGELKEEEEQGTNLSFDEQVKIEHEYRRPSTLEEQENQSERSATPSTPATPLYSTHTPQHRADTPEYNLAQGYSLVSTHPQHQGYTQFVSHPLLHQIQSNWSAMYSHIQHPPQ